MYDNQQEETSPAAGEPDTRTRAEKRKPDPEGTPVRQDPPEEPAPSFLRQEEIREFEELLKQTPVWEVRVPSTVDDLERGGHRISASRITDLGTLMFRLAEALRRALEAERIARRDLERAQIEATNLMNIVHRRTRPGPPLPPRAADEIEPPPGGAEENYRTVPDFGLDSAYEEREKPLLQIDELARQLQHAKDAIQAIALLL